MNICIVEQIDRQQMNKRIERQIDRWKEGQADK